MNSITPSAPADLSDLLATALTARTKLLTELATAETTAYRLFSGDAEGFPGLSVDRYGDILLVQSFHSPLNAEQLASLDGFYTRTVPGLTLIFNDRSHANSHIGNPLPPAQLDAAMLPRDVHESGVLYRMQGRHEGHDPLLFLDLRAARRRIVAEAPGKTVLNVFSYTCSAGIAAAKAGASFVVNVDISEPALSIGKESVRLNTLPIRPRFVKSDAFAAMRQLASIGQPERVRGKRMPPFPKLEQRQFDLVFIDPPQHAKSLFGVVDLAGDYASVFKPALLCTVPGGTLICTNSIAAVAPESWQDQLQRTASKAGRPIREFEWITPDADFPGSELKIALLRV